MKLDPKWLVLAFVAAMCSSAALVATDRLPVKDFFGVVMVLLAWLSPSPRPVNPPSPGPDQDQPPVTTREGRKP